MTDPRTDTKDILGALNELDSLMMQADLANKDAREASEGRHTPGPWTVGTHLDEGTDLTRGEYVVFPVPFDEEAKANARLIAAAPEMLAALQGFLAAFDKDMTALVIAKLKAQAAIAKSTPEGS